MADAARKLLDSLMGNTRDQDLSKAKEMKGKNFMQDTVCKNYLLGFCPLTELAESKLAGKRNFRDCTLVHSDATRDEFEAHPEKEKYTAEYEKVLLPLLEGLVREADQWVAREKANVQKVDTGVPEVVTTNNMPPSIKEQYDQMKEDMNKMMASAETEAEKGNVDGSKFKVMLADEIKAKLKEHEEKYIVTYNVTHRGEEVCEICGTRYEALTATNQARYNAHFTGKVHLAYVKIREWIKKIQKKAREDGGRGRRSGSRDRRDNRKRSRSTKAPGGRRSRSRRGDDRRDDRDASKRDRRERSRSRRRR